MKNRALRLTLVILFVAATGAVGYFIWTTEARLRAQADTARDFDASIIAAGRSTLELRAAQHAYVAAGQGDDFWTSKVAAILPQLSVSIVGLRATAASADAQSALDAAAGLLKDLEQTDLRARELVRGDRKLLASDLIFSDGLEMTRGLANALDGARGAEVRHRESAGAALRRSELVAVGGLAAFGLLAMLLLLPRGREPGEIAPIESSLSGAILPIASPLNADDDALDLALALDGPAARPTAEQAADSKGVASLNLSSIASLCTELARVVDTRSLPSILERTAAVLDAPGIILWIADPDGRELTPIVAHGYPQQLLSRLGTIARDAENATAAAFRTGLIQTVKSDAVSNGAIAAPLVTPGGAVGVMAAEVRHEGEQEAAKLAAASIVAAQLATLVGPPASRVQTKAEIAGA